MNCILDYTPKCLLMMLAIWAITFPVAHIGLPIMRKLFIAMAAIEIVTGLGLIVLPAMLAWLLLGSVLDAPPATIIARIGGVALLSLGTACWFASRDENSPAAAGVMAAMVLYNCGATILLAYAGIVQELSGLGLWPAVVVHTVLAVGSIASVKSRATSIPIR